MGIEPTQDGSTAPQTVLKTAPVTRPEAAPLCVTVCEARHAVNAAPAVPPCRRPATGHRVNSVTTGLVHPLGGLS